MSIFEERQEQSLLEQLQALQAKREQLQQEEALRQQAEQQRIKDIQIAKGYIEDRFLQALDSFELDPKLARVYFDNTEEAVKPDNYLWTVQKLLSDPIYGLQRLPKGFVWAGKTYKDLSLLQSAVEERLGMFYPDFLGADYFGHMVRSVLRGSDEMGLAKARYDYLNRGKGNKPGPDIHWDAINMLTSAGIDVLGFS